MANPPDSNEARRRAQRGRNIVLGLVLASLCLLFYLITIAKMA
jgi:hypothetical protein